jgi:hypothetical protein
MKNDPEKQIRLIRSLAKRLPWITVGIVLLTVMVVIIEMFIGKG